MDYGLSMDIKEYIYIVSGFAGVVLPFGNYFIASRDKSFCSIAIGKINYNII